MKVKTSITLSPDVLKTIDRLAGRRSNRSRVIETAVIEFVKRRDRVARDARELALLNLAADTLNAEMADILRDQVDV